MLIFTIYGRSPSTGELVEMDGCRVEVQLVALVTVPFKGDMDTHHITVTVSRRTQCRHSESCRLPSYQTTSAVASTWLHDNFER